MGGVTRLPRLCGRVGEYGGGAEYWYCDSPDHALVEFGDSGPKCPFIVWVYYPVYRKIEILNS